jgi:hypothetical protein
LGGCGAASLRHYLQAAIVGFTHDDAPIAVHSNTIGISQLTYAASLAANAAQVSTVFVPQHLHPMIRSISHNQGSRTVKHYSPGQTELTVTCSVSADGAQVLPIAVP